MSRSTDLAIWHGSTGACHTGEPDLQLNGGMGRFPSGGFHISPKGGRVGPHDGCPSWQQRRSNDRQRIKPAHQQAATAKGVSRSPSRPITRRAHHENTYRHRCARASGLPRPGGGRASASGSIVSATHRVLLLKAEAFPPHCHSLRQIGRQLPRHDHPTRLDGPLGSAIMSLQPRRLPCYALRIFPDSRSNICRRTFPNLRTIRIWPVSSDRPCSAPPQ
ncbi:hypothetical protein SAMN02927914_03866 [Mesorhizobium qingshengii]|uniref:Uncharacterized protein n=1 Tax=Mesorhizobium qingshengii TaxID=1165689 RepID=A0A1G5YYP0_9HYPH|nr:hypothetical protein SAMN02927914_03866 [Mesorhizobium qingshengii]